MTSSLEETFLLLALAADLPMPEREYRFDASRRWRFDFAWPKHLIAVEIEGGIWNNGAHVRGEHYISDCRKYNTAVSHGWRVFRLTGEMLAEGVELVASALSEVVS